MQHARAHTHTKKTPSSVSVLIHLFSLSQVILKVHYVGFWEGFINWKRRIFTGWTKWTNSLRFHRWINKLTFKGAICGKSWFLSLVPNSSQKTWRRTGFAIRVSRNPSVSFWPFWRCMSYKWRLVKGEQYFIPFYVASKWRTLPPF